MALRDDLKILGVKTEDPRAVITWIARLPIIRTERLRLLRQWERETQEPFDPRDFARAVDGIPPG